MKVSENIKAIREAKGIKQSDVAKAIGVERTNYHRIEHKGNKLTIEQLESIAQALGVSMIEILDPQAGDLVEASRRARELEIENQELRVEVDRSNRVIDVFTYILSGGKGMDPDRTKEIISSIEPDMEEAWDKSFKRMEK